jgi:hypothetical protein
VKLNNFMEDFSDNPIKELEISQAFRILKMYFPDKSVGYLKDCASDLVEHFRILHARE